MSVKLPPTIPAGRLPIGKPSTQAAHRASTGQLAHTASAALRAYRTVMSSSGSSFWIVASNKS
jgi:hypothetical protein